MFTRPAASEKPKAKVKQTGSSNCQPADGSALHIVKHRHQKHGVSQASKALRKGERRGGWKTTRYLDHDQFKRAYSDALSLCRAGYGPTVFVSLMPPDSVQPDAARIRWIDTKLSRLGQALKRRKQPDVRFRTLEKKAGGKLHGHAPIYVRPENLDVIERMFDVFDKSRVIAFAANDDAQNVAAHAALIGETQDDLLNAILYPLKQHRWAGPGHDGSGSARRFWIEAGDPIRGQRLSVSKAAKAILAGIQPAAAKSAPPAAVDAPIAVPDPRVAPPPQIEQLAFDFDAPVIDIRSGLEAAWIERGLSQRQLAAVLGMKQPHYSNSVVRRHDPLSAYARRRALEWLNAA